MPLPDDNDDDIRHSHCDFVKKSCLFLYIAGTYLYDELQNCNRHEHTDEYTDERSNEDSHVDAHEQNPNARKLNFAEKTTLLFNFCRYYGKTKIDHKIYALKQLGININLYEVPDDLRCPITHRLMRNPVYYGPARKFYEYGAITPWITNHNTDPWTNLLMKDKYLCKDYSKDAEILAYLNSLTEPNIDHETQKLLPTIQSGARHMRQLPLLTNKI